MSRLSCFLVTIVTVLLVFPVEMAVGYPTEASGQVTKVVYGDTFDVEIEQSDRNITGTIRIRLADVTCPPVDTLWGGLAKDSTEILLNGTCFIDLDDKTGQDEFGRWIAVVYPSNNTKEDVPMPTRICLNRILIDMGMAELDDDFSNEFDPGDWWT